MKKIIYFKLYKGYRLIVVDGSILPISIDINDKETYLFNHSKNEKGYNACYLYVSYDLLEHTYDDIYGCITTNLDRDEFPLEEIII